MEQKPKSGTIQKGAEFLALFLIGCYVLSFAASYHYLAETLRHFIFQYALISGVLGLFFLLSKSRVWFLAMLVVLVATTFEYRSQLQRPEPHMFRNGSMIKVATYNRRYGMDSHDDLETWLKSQIPDVAIIQEAGEEHLKVIKRLSLIYPYVFSDPRDNHFGVVIASRRPILESKVVATPSKAVENFYTRIVIESSPDMQISIYSLHALPPMNASLQEQRNIELKQVAKAIQQDENDTVIFMGDWNITPFSPYFSKLLKDSGLKNEYISTFIIPTWPSDFLNTVFQIPIDHITHKGRLRLVAKYRGAAYGSDHYPLVAVYGFDKVTR